MQNFVSCSTGDRQRQHSQGRGERRHEDGIDPLQRSFSNDIVGMQSLGKFGVVVVYQQQPIANSNPKQGDKANQRSDLNNASGEHDGENTPHQRQGQIDHNGDRGRQ